MMIYRSAGLLSLATALCAMPEAASAQQAQNVPAEDESTSDLKEEVARLRAEVEAMRAEMKSMRAATAAAPAGSGTSAVAANGGAAPAADPQAAPVPAATPAPAPALAANTAKKADPVQIAWKGAPEFKGEGGWSFKPRGRFQIDGGYLRAPATRFTGQVDGRGFTSRVRRVYFGAQGTMPGGFTYRAEVDLSGNAVSWTDLYLSYDKGPFTFTVGQHHPFTSMEQIQSDLFLSFNERASFIGAFNLERRVGVSATYNGKSLLASAGIFTDDMGSLTNDGDKSVSFDGRVIWMPKVGDTQFHLGGSAHYRKLGDFAATLGTRYRQRPYIATTDIRYIDTGVLTVFDETHLGLEFAMNRGRMHVAGESAWLKVNRPGDADPTFFGGYAEIGFFLTNDSRSYKNSVFDRTTPRRPVSSGGIGALELNLRYDRLDLTDANIGGGTQDGFGAGFVWNPTAYVRFMLNYMHLIYDIPSAQPKFTADSVGMRAEVDF